MDAAYRVICEQKQGNGMSVVPRVLSLRTRSGEWRPLCSVLLPGRIVTEAEGTDGDVAVDLRVHGADLELMRRFEVTDAPWEYCNLSAEPWFQGYRSRWRNEFTQRKLPSNPRLQLLGFQRSHGFGPLEVLGRLSDEGAARYTDALLSREEIYESWTMRHTTRVDSYPEHECESPHIDMLRRHGRIRTANEDIVPFAQALGAHPERGDALHALLVHPKADRIKAAFNLAEPAPEFLGEEDPVPLTDVWPGLKRHLRSHQRARRLIRCERILVIGEEKACVAHASDIYLSALHDEDEDYALRLVLRELGLALSGVAVEDVLQFERREEVESARATVRRSASDAERLLAAVGERVLRNGLPDSLLAVLESERLGLNGMEIAEAAIATWHTDALKQYRASLERLDPPSRWAGSKGAVRFVRSLGFLDAGAFASTSPEHVIRELQGMGVLAHADHASIEGETFSPETLAADDWERVLEELDRASELPWLPQSVENRIAQSAERTRRIIEAYETHIDPHWPTLIFATSVEHAQTVAALLNRKGIPSRAVSGTTETATRRRVVEGFRCGEIQALVNMVSSAKVSTPPRHAQS